MDGIFDKNENLNLKLIAVSWHRNNLTYRRQSALRHSPQKTKSFDERFKNHFLKILQEACYNIT